MRNLKMTVEYDGTNYHGYQFQKDPALPTIQGVLEAHLTELTGENITIMGASRTDAGVHARGQVVNFRTNWRIPADKLPLAVNSTGLPMDIAIKNAEEVPLNFHAQFLAQAKTYTYTIYNSRIPSPFHHRYSLYVPQRLRVEEMGQAMTHLVGTHDFSAFKAAGSSVRSSVRTIFQAYLQQEGPLVVLTFRGNGFLYNMIRIMTGTLLEVGKGKLQPADIDDIIASKNRSRARMTVPPQGLCLEKIEY